MIPNEYLSEEYRGYNINWFYDECPDDPRNWDNVSKIICWHRRYNLGDNHNYSDVESFLSTLVEKYASHDKLKEYLLSKKGNVWLEYIEHTPKEQEFYGCKARVALGIGGNFNGDYWECSGPEEKDEAIDFAVDQSPLERLNSDDVEELLENELVMCPVSLYDHSGLNIYIGSPQCRWDSGYVGFIYQTKQDTLHNWSDATEDNWKDIAMKHMEAEMETYNYYVSGQVYGYVIEDEEGEEIDSCWGYFGDEDAQSQNLQNRLLVDDVILCQKKLELILSSFGWN